LKVKLESNGGEIKHEGWNPEKVKTIVIEFHGKLSSKYTYPISPEDKIKEIVVRVEE